MEYRISLITNSRPWNNFFPFSFCTFQNLKATASNQGNQVFINCRGESVTSRCMFTNVHFKIMTFPPYLADNPRKSILFGSVFRVSNSQRRAFTNREFLMVTGSSSRTPLWSIPDLWTLGNNSKQVCLGYNIYHYGIMAYNIMALWHTT